MNRLIYNGPDKGVYNYTYFQKFMEECKAELIKEKCNVDDLFHIWFFPEQGVVVNYNNIEENLKGKALVVLHGFSDEDIGKVEKIILDKAKE